MGGVSNPTAGDVHVNRPLTNFAQKYLQDEQAFIATKAFPNLPVSKQSDLYGIFDRADFYRDEAKERADGTESEGSGFTLSTTPYFCKVYAFHKDVTDRQRSNQDDWVKLDESASQFVTHKLLIRRERLFLQAFFATGIWTTDLTGVASGATAGQFNRWDGSTSDPIADVRYAIELVQGRTGYRPNKMIISRQVWNKLVDNDALLARITGGATKDMPAQVLRTLVAQLFELEQIFVSDAVSNTAVDGATEATSFMAGKHVLVYYAPNTTSGQEPTAGVQFSWTGFLGATTNGMRIKRFRMEPIEADRIEGQMAFTYQKTGAELGVFLNGAIA
jgi:hypothetical protein